MLIKSELVGNHKEAGEVCCINPYADKEPKDLTIAGVPTEFVPKNE
jgi:hypothetical protein